ncbi:hypothetical protein [Streptomyces canus]|nr:hypothetical protein [Streptomyces canus]
MFGGAFPLQGAHTPEETAISIAAEIIAHADNGTGLPLSHGS